MCGRCLMSKLPCWANNQGVRWRIREQNLVSKVKSKKASGPARDGMSGWPCEGTPSCRGNASPSRGSRGGKVTPGLACQQDGWSVTPGYGGSHGGGTTGLYAVKGPSGEAQGKTFNLCYCQASFCWNVLQRGISVSLSC